MRGISEDSLLSTVIYNYIHSDIVSIAGRVTGRGFEKNSITLLKAKTELVNTSSVLSTNKNNKSYL